MLFMLPSNCGTVSPLRLLDGSTVYLCVCVSVYVPVFVWVYAYFSASAYVQTNLCTCVDMPMCFVFVCVFDKWSVQHWNVSALISAWFSPGVNRFKMPPRECSQSWSLAIQLNCGGKQMSCSGIVSIFYGLWSHKQSVFTSCFWVKNKQHTYQTNILEEWNNDVIFLKVYKLHSSIL